MSSLRIKYKKSIIGYSQDQKDTVRSLGLRKLNQVVVCPDSPSIRGMLFKVRHLVTFEEVDEAASLSATQAPRTQSFAPRIIAPPPAAVETTRPVIAEVEQPAAVEAAQPVIAEVEQPAAVEAAQPVTDASDDLTVIEGIGPMMAQALHEAGIGTFAQLAATDADKLRDILQEQPRLRLADPTTWPQQASLAAAGQWDEFKQLTARLQGGREA